MDEWYTNDEHTVSTPKSDLIGAPAKCGVKYTSVRLLVWESRTGLALADVACMVDHGVHGIRYTWERATDKSNETLPIRNSGS